MSRWRVRIIVNALNKNVQREGKKKNDSGVYTLFQFKSYFITCRRQKPKTTTHRISFAESIVIAH